MSFTQGTPPQAGYETGVRRAGTAAVMGALAALALGGAAQATVIFTGGNVPQQDENVLFGSQQTGISINGVTNQTNTPVLFTSTQTLQTGGQGQAFLDGPNGGLVNNFTFTVPGSTFTSLIFNPRFGSGTATVTAVANDGTFPFSYQLGNGNNFLTITTADGETLSSVTVSAPGGFDQLQQVRVGGIAAVPPPPVPEPASMALLGAGLVALGLVRRRHNG